MSLRAKLTPMAAAIAALPRNAAATDAAPTLAVMSEVSSALRVTELAEIPVAPSPSIKALTTSAI